MSRAAAAMEVPLWAVLPATVRRPLRVVVLNRHALTRAGLTQLLSQGGDRSSVVEGPIHSSRLRGHDVVVFDLTGLTGTIWNDLAVVLAADVPVVALTPSARPDLVETVLAMGATGAVSMDLTVAALLQGAGPCRFGSDRRSVGPPARTLWRCSGHGTAFKP